MQWPPLGLKFCDELHGILSLIPVNFHKYLRSFRAQNYASSWNCSVYPQVLIFPSFKLNLLRRQYKSKEQGMVAYLPTYEFNNLISYFSQRDLVEYSDGFAAKTCSPGVLIKSLNNVPLISSTRFFRNADGFATMTCSAVYMLGKLFSIFSSAFPVKISF